MARSASLLSFSALAVLVACSGSSDNPLIAPPGGDAGSSSSSDSATGADGSRDPTTCDLARCGITIPAGFTLATSGSDGTCPSGFTSRNLVSDPVAGDGACACACNVTQKPDCTKGMIGRAIDYTQSPTCGTQATTLMATGSGCNPFSQPITTQGWHYAAAIAPSGGACTFDAKVDDSKVTSKPVALCDAPAECPGAVCGSTNVCVTKPGDVECPTGFPSKRLAGAKPKVECGACGGLCTLKAECDGTLSFFMDGQCTTGKLDFPVDGTCNPNLYAYTYYSWSFQGSTKNTTCSTPPSSTASATLDQPTTVCCQK